MTDWTESANCAGLADAMFPQPRDGKDIRTAQGICDNCDVREECLTAALAEEAGKGKYHRYGIRGGLTPAQRAHLAMRPASTEVTT